MTVEPARSPWLSLIPLCIAVALYKIDTTIVNVALPTIQQDLGVSPERLLWTVNAYILALAAVIPLAGSLGDRFGRRRVFLVGIVVFTAASAGCALSPSDGVLIGFRVLQGLAAGVLVPLSMGIIGATFRHEDLPSAYGYWSAFSSIGIVIGPLAGGVLVEQVGWSSVFWVNVPLGLMLLPMVRLMVEETRDPAARRLDLAGAALSTAGILLVSWALIGTTATPWLTAGTLVPLALGVLALVGFVLWERRSPEPMLPLAFFRAPGFALGAVVGMLVYAYPAIMLFLTLYFQGILDEAPERAGFLFVPLAATLTVTAVFAGPITKRIGAFSSMAIGMLVMGAGTAGFAMLPVAGSIPWLFAAEIVMAVGIMLTIPAAGAVMMGAVPKERAGVASAAMQAFRQIGAVLGVAIFGAIAAARATGVFEATAPPSAATPQVLQHVIGAEADQVQRLAGAAAAELARAAWVDGMHLAMLVITALCLGGAVACGLAARRRWRAEHGHPAAPHS